MWELCCLWDGSWEFARLGWMGWCTHGHSCDGMLPDTCRQREGCVCVVSAMAPPRMPEESHIRVCVLDHEEEGCWCCNASEIMQGPTMWQVK